MWIQGAWMQLEMKQLDKAIKMTQNEAEDALMMKAIIDVNLPKFLD